MPKVTVELGERSYPIHVGRNLLGQIGTLIREVSRARRALVVSDHTTSMFYEQAVLSALATGGIEASAVQVPPGEGSKSLARLEALYEAALDARLERRDCIVAVGGGVVGDLAGFAAATYLRGVDFIQVPTTLLAQVDASVGGKVAVNLARGKNLVGSFHQPRVVIADIDTLRTLPPRQLAAGMAEVVKHGVIRDPAYFAYLEEHAGAIRAQEFGRLLKVVIGSCEIKARVVAADEREESGERAHLNFGHTIAHAVEAALGYEKWLHGEAVAVGMVAAARLARTSGHLQEPALVERLERLLRLFDLPTGLPAGVDSATLLHHAAFDKKVAEGKVRWVLPVRLGQVSLVADVSPDLVESVLAEMPAAPAN